MCIFSLIMSGNSANFDKVGFGKRSSDLFYLQNSLFLLNVLFVITGCRKK